LLFPVKRYDWHKRPILLNLEFASIIFWVFNFRQVKFLLVLYIEGL